MPLLAGLGPLGVPELLIIAFIIILIFGVGRIPEVGGALGKGIREFRKSTKDDDPDGPPTMSSAADVSGAAMEARVSDAAMSGDSRFCSECGTKNERAAKFCAECGHTMSAAAV